MHPGRNASRNKPLEPATTPRLFQGDVNARETPAAYLQSGRASLEGVLPCLIVCGVVQGARWLLSSEGHRI